MKALLIPSVERRSMSKLPDTFQKVSVMNKGPRVLMARQKWHKPSILVLNILRKLNAIKQTIKQQCEYLKF